MTATNFLRLKLECGFEAHLSGTPWSLTAGPYRGVLMSDMYVLACFSSAASWNGCVLRLASALLDGGRASNEPTEPNTLIIGAANDWLELPRAHVIRYKQQLLCMLCQSPNRSVQQSRNERPIATGPSLLFQAAIRFPSAVYDSFWEAGF